MSYPDYEASSFIKSSQDDSFVADFRRRENPCVRSMRSRMILWNGDEAAAINHLSFLLSHACRFATI